MKYVVGLFTTAILAAATPAAAETWRMVGNGGTAPQRSVYLLDTDSISRTGNKVRFRTTTVWEGVTDERDFDKSITMREGDCGTMSSKIVANSYYRNSMLQSSDDLEGSMLKHGETSLMYGVMDAVCRGVGFESGPLQNPEASVRSWFKTNP